MALDFERERERMVVEQLEARGIHDSSVLAAIRNVPRHRGRPADPTPAHGAARPSRLPRAADGRGGPAEPRASAAWCRGVGRGVPRRVPLREAPRKLRVGGLLERCGAGAGWWWWRRS